MSVRSLSPLSNPALYGLSEEQQSTKPTTPTEYKDNPSPLLDLDSLQAESPLEQEKSYSEKGPGSPLNTYTPLQLPDIPEVHREKNLSKEPLRAPSPQSTRLLPSPERLLHGVAYMAPFPFKEPKEDQPLEFVDQLTNILRNRKVTREDLKSLNLSEEARKALYKINVAQKDIIKRTFPSSHLTTTRYVQQFMLSQFGKIIPAEGIDDDWILQNHLTVLSGPPEPSLQDLINIANAYNFNLPPPQGKSLSDLEKVKVLRYCHQASPANEITPEIIGRLKKIASDNDALSVKAATLLMRAVFGITYMRAKVKQIMEEHAIPIKNRLNTRPQKGFSMHLVANVLEGIERRQIEEIPLVKP